MQNKTVLILSLLFAFISAFAQDEEGQEGVLSTRETVELISGQIIDLGSPIINETVQITQIGDNNQLNAIQQLNSISTYIFTAVQNGNKNIGYLKQEGTDHESILFQSGNLNIANLKSFGTNTQNFVYQEGNENIANSTIENNNFELRSALLFQKGDSNRIDLELTGLNTYTRGVSVKQNGSFNDVELFLNSFEVPYFEIIQTGTYAPAVSVTHSDFNFPTK